MKSNKVKKSDKKKKPAVVDNGIHANEWTKLLSLMKERLS